jgi:hypothetical protein
LKTITHVYSVNIGTEPQRQTPKPVRPEDEGTMTNEKCVRALIKYGSAGLKIWQQTYDKKIADVRSTM